MIQIVELTYDGETYYAIRRIGWFGRKSYYSTRSFGSKWCRRHTDIVDYCLEKDINNLKIYIDILTRHEKCISNERVITDLEKIFLKS